MNHNVEKAVIFLGYLSSHDSLYQHLKQAGFIPEFRPVKILACGVIDGNVDADLASYVMDYKNEYDKAIIVADDGDYWGMIKRLLEQQKLGAIISSHLIKKSSRLIKSIVTSNMILSIHSLRNQIEKRA